MFSFFFYSPKDKVRKGIGCKNCQSCEGIPNVDIEKHKKNKNTIVDDIKFIFFSERSQRCGTNKRGTNCQKHQGQGAKLSKYSH